jgi:large subunit ribosomal protein L21
MYVIVDLNGHQHKVTKGDVLTVEKLKDVKEGDSVVSDKVLLKFDEKTTEVGTPYLAGAKVEFKILEHGRHRKIRVFKKKSKKRYERTQGHRQQYTKVEVLSVK